MDDYSRIAHCKFDCVINNDEMAFLQSELLSVDGIKTIDIKPESVGVEYNTLRLSGEYIRNLIKDMGYPLRGEREKKVGKLTRFIQNLAKSNKKSFGNKKLDCCDLKH